MNPEHLSRLNDVYRKRSQVLDEINRASPWHALHRRLTSEKLRTWIPGGKVLDLAAGTGLTSRELAARGCKVTMLDIMPEMCALARESVPAACAENVEVLCADACCFREFPACDYDAAICTQALNFFEDPGSLFATAAFALRPGGIFYFDIDTAYRWAIIEALTGRIDNATAILEQGVDAGRFMIGTDYFFYPQSRLEDELRRNGFEVVAVFGLLHATPLLRLLHPAIDYLEPEALDPLSGQFVHAEKLEELLRLEEKLMRIYPAETAGYQAFVARRTSI